MFLQQSPKKERTKSATLSAPANMLAFRSPQQQAAASATASSTSNGPSTNSNSTTSTTANTSSNTANTSTSTSDSSTLFLPSMDHQQYPQKFPSLATPQTQAKAEPTPSKPESPKKKSAAGPRQLTPSAIQQQHHSHSHSSNDTANTSLGSLPTSAYLPGSLPGVSSSLSDLPGGKSSTTTTSSNRQPKIPQSKRAPQDPYNAPGVSFRSSLRPPASAQIPDIPYGEGMVPRPKRQRAFSGASSSVATSNGTATAGVGSGVKARVFTPSDAHTNIRVGEDTPTNRQGANYTSRNMAGGQPVHQIVASSPASAQARASAVPKGTLVTPSAPLTVNAPVVPAKESLVTSLDPQHIENFKQSTPQPGPNASPSKQPVKSALKAKSWADLVRPMSNVSIAQEAVKNVGFTQDQVNNSAKKRVSIALPSRASDATSEASTPTGPSRAGTPSDQLTTMRVPTHSTIVTAEGNDKSPHHRSPPPERTLDAAIQAGENGGGPGDIARSTSPGRAPSVHSNFTATSGGSNHLVLNNMMAKQRSLDDLLAGVETSKSRVTLYPRGLVNTGNACFMNSILQTLLFTAPFYNLISLIGAYTSEDLSGRTPLLDAMVSYLSEFKTSNPERESQLGRGESYEEQLQKNDAFIPSIIYHALNNNARFAQMGFSTGSTSASGINHSYSSSSAPLTKANLAMNTNHLSQEDAQEFLGFFLDTIHEELLIKTEAWDKQRWEKANRGMKAGMDSLARQSVNSIDEYENSLLANQAQAPQGVGNPASVIAQPNGAGADSASVNAAEDDEWLEVGQKGRTATTRTTQTQESAVTRIFGGKLRSVLRCPGQKDSVTLEPFMSLQLEIQSPQIHTVTDALEAIAEPETLHDVTNRQNLKVEATKQVFIESLPPVLILHLKRFIYDARAGVSKSHKIISYDTELEIPKECIAPSRRTHVDKRRYRLTGVVFHHGKTASGGHYSVCCRQNNGRWVNIDDTTISPIAAEDAALDRDRENLRLSLPSASSLFGVPEKSAYLLFYQRL